MNETIKEVYRELLSLGFLAYKIEGLEFEYNPEWVNKIIRHIEKHPHIIM